MFSKKKGEKLDISSLNEILYTGKKIINIGLIMAVIALVVLVTYLVKEWHILGFLKDLFLVISPIFIGLIIAWLLDPIVCFLEKKKIPRVIACILVYLVVIGGIFLLFSFMLPTFIDQIKEFIGAIPDILKDTKDFITDFFNSFQSHHDLDLSQVKKELYLSIEQFGTNITTSFPTLFINLTKSVANIGMNLILGLMIGFYMLYDFNKVNENLSMFIPNSWKENVEELKTRVNESLRGYVQGVFLIMFLVFITQSIGLTLAGLKAPLIFALFCALTDIIPYFGPYIGAIPALIVGFTMSPMTGIFTLISILVVQLLENNFYQPLIMGHTMKLHPVTIMVSLLIFQHFFGIIGMIVATPVVASIKVIFMFINEKTNVYEKVTKDIS